MKYKEHSFNWEWNFKSTPEDLWPYVSDTNKFDRDIGLSPVRRELSTDDGRPTLSTSRGGFSIRWKENPFEWVYPHRFSVIRNYINGPFLEMRVHVELSPYPDGGTKLLYQIRIIPRNLLGHLVLPIIIGKLARRKILQVFRRYDTLSLTGETNRFLRRTAHLTSDALLRLDKAIQKLSIIIKDLEMITRLKHLIKEGDELSLNHIRPYELADVWKSNRKEVLELCLEATRAGLLELRWDILCPYCRGVKQSYDSMIEIQSTIHCDSCLIDFSVNFEQLVELTFRPNAAIREVQVQEFCIGGPQITPHILLQESVRPKQTETIRIILKEGHYRLRTLKKKSQVFITVSPTAAGKATFSSDNTNSSQKDIQIAPSTDIEFQNSNDHTELFILEKLSWTELAATATDVISLQRFRDLFSGEVLRMDQQISVGSISVLFTDLKASTQLYREIGDAPAYGLVMDHFDILKKAISAEDGIMVKTIGDAVMAVFKRPVQAIRTVLNSQKALAVPPPGKKTLILKAGIHYGPAIAVTLNNRMDYFGSTVNLASRLEHISTGNDMVISDEIKNDTEVIHLLSQTERPLLVTPIETTLKGFEGERFQVWRISPSSG